VNLEHVLKHHDAIEFPNGRIVLLTDLRRGQRATVLQLPVIVQAGRCDEPLQAGPMVIDVEPIRTSV
jgi:hypothetical protein